MESITSPKKIATGVGAGLLAYPLYTAIHQENFRIRTRNKGLVDYEPSKVLSRTTDATAYSIVLGLVQVFTPELVPNKDLQTVIINPFIASSIHYILKETYLEGRIFSKFMVKTYAVGVTTSAISSELVSMFL